MVDTKANRFSQVTSNRKSLKGFSVSFNCENSSYKSLFRLFYLEISIVQRLEISKVQLLEISKVQNLEISRHCTIEISRKSRRNKLLFDEFSQLRETVKTPLRGFL